MSVYLDRTAQTTTLLVRTTPRYNWQQSVHGPCGAIARGGLATTAIQVSMPAGNTKGTGTLKPPAACQLAR
jgi:hypothetical protein